MNAGIFVLLGVTVAVLGGFAAFFMSLVRRAQRTGPADATDYRAAGAAGASGAPAATSEAAGSA